MDAQVGMNTYTLALVPRELLGIPMGKMGS